MENYKDPNSIHRELDPGVFGQTPHSPSGYAPSIPSHGLQPPPSTPQTHPGRAIPFPPIDIKVMEAQIQQIRAVTQQCERKQDALSARLNEMARESQSRLDRYEQQMLRLEDGISRLTRDTGDRLAALAGRVNERKLSDQKVQELVDRHNLMVRNFENRLSSLQKLAGDQEQALLSAFAALEDARAELSRLKRMT